MQDMREAQESRQARGRIARRGLPKTSCWRARLSFAWLLKECGDLARDLLELAVFPVGGDPVLQCSAALGPFLLETPALTRGCLTRFLLGALAGEGFCLLLLPTQALFLSLARGLFL